MTSEPKWKFPFKDRSGQRVGKWLILGRVPAPIGKSSCRVWWECQCDCGTKKAVCSGTLFSGNSYSCGCTLKHKLEDCSSEQIEIINGLLLGDGCIYCPKFRRTKHHRLSTVRQAGDIDYLNWHFSKLQFFYSSVPKLYSTFDNRTQKTYYSCSVSSRSAPAFKELYDKWYPDGKKIVPKDLILTPLTIAVWFCDDGHMRFNNKRETQLSIQFATHGFIKTDIEYLASLLNARYSEYFGVYKNGNGHIIKASNKACCKIIKDIDEVFPVSMIRKAIWRINPKAAAIVENQAIAREP